MVSKERSSSFGSPSTVVSIKPEPESGDCSSENTMILSENGKTESLWSWVIVFASFMCNVIVDGIIFSFGVLILEISKELKQSKGTTAWIGSLQAGFYLFVGPLVSTLANHYGCRIVTIVGSLIASLGFILSFFANGVTWLCLSYGVLSGIGLGFIYLPAIVMVGHYFERRRAFATGIAVCGSGVGAFLMAPIVQFLNEEFGWRGCILILAGIILNCAVFGALFRPLPESNDEESDGSGKPLLGRSKESWLESDEDSCGLNYSNHHHASAFSEHGSHESGRKHTSRRYTFSEGCRTNIDHQSGRHRRPRSNTYHMNYVFQSEILYNALSLQEIRNGKQRPTVTFNTARRQSVLEEATTCVKLLDLSLLLSPSFLLLGISGFLTLAGFFIPFMYIVDRSIQTGTSSEKSAFLLSIIGITNTVGRIFCGWISDSPKVKPLFINNIALVIGGVATALSPLICNTFSSLVIYCLVFGFSIACFVALRSVITIELLGLERLTSAFGLLLLPQGIATIIGGPIAGWFFDVTGSYDASFHIAGAVIMISGIMCFPLSMISNWEKSRQRKATGQC